MERTFRNYVRSNAGSPLSSGNRGRYSNSHDIGNSRHHLSQKKMIQRYGNSYIVSLTTGTQKMRFMIGPHWLGVVFTVMVIIAGTWLNVRMLSKHTHFQPETVRFFHVFIVFFFITTNLFLFLTATTDPGILFGTANDLESSTNDKDTCDSVTEADTDSRGLLKSNQLNPGVNRFNSPTTSQSGEYCEVCRIYQPDHMNVYHCTDCDYCIEDCDHHCPWMGQCIGRKNMRYFMYFNASWVIFFSEFLYMAFVK